MAEIAEMTPQRTVKLPAEIATRFGPTDRFIVWVEGDTLYLKHIGPPPLELNEQTVAQSKTLLGRQLRQARAKIVAQGDPLLSWTEIEQEIVSRRGGYAGDEPR